MLDLCKRQLVSDPSPGLLKKDCLSKKSKILLKFMKVNLRSLKKEWVTTLKRLERLRLKGKLSTLTRRQPDASSTAPTRTVRREPTQSMRVAKTARHLLIKQLLEKKNCKINPRPKKSLRM